MGEITVILLLALIFLGPSKLPDLAAGLGKLIREIRKATSDVKNEIVLDDSFRKPFEELRDAVTLPPEELKRRDQVRKNLEEARRREEEAARAAAAVNATVADPVASLPAETPAEAATAAVMTPAAEGAEVAAQTPAVVPPVAPPAGTIARNRPSEPVVAAVPMTPAEPPPAVPAPPPVSHAPRVVPPVSSLDSPRANVTQALSEADLLTSAPTPPRRSTPPPLPGLSRAAATARPVRPTPAAGVPAPGPNTTQVLSDNDLLPPGSSAQPGVKPPPVPEAPKDLKKT